ncbi:MAG: glycosyltransferase [Chitinivibrionales bacterium]|nr:glycosyltransferase [Chitinivibrionales bacterium]
MKVDRVKINILYEFKDNAWGGGNQFLKALQAEFRRKEVYEDEPGHADVILFNSFPFREEYRFRQIAELKKDGKIIFHRIDGPVSSIRGKDKYIDKLIYIFNMTFADASIFQSEWSKNENYRLGIRKNPEIVISNAADAAIFNRISKDVFTRNRKVRLIATSWSSNWRKGFDIYEYLDKNLDFSKYEMTFIGNSPIEFKNVIKKDPLPSYELAAELKKHDLYITASEKDPCSNSLIEALSCGLPAVALMDGGHPEIIGAAGVFFTGKKNVLEAIDRAVIEYDTLVRAIVIPSITECAMKYYDFMRETHSKIKTKVLQRKMVGQLQQHIFFLKIRILKHFKI